MFFEKCSAMPCIAVIESLFLFVQLLFTIFTGKYLLWYLLKLILVQILVAPASNILSLYSTPQQQFWYLYDVAMQWHLVNTSIACICTLDVCPFHWGYLVYMGPFPTFDARIFYSTSIQSIRIDVSEINIDSVHWNKIE